MRVNEPTAQRRRHAGIDRDFEHTEGLAHVWSGDGYLTIERLDTPLGDTLRVDPLFFDEFERCLVAARQSFTHTTGMADTFHQRDNGLIIWVYKGEDLKLWDLTLTPPQFSRFKLLAYEVLDWCREKAGVTK